MESRRHKVVIIGGGFGGLQTAKNLKHPEIDVTLIDSNNYHLFQPLLYQVATGGLSPADISAPLRHILRKNRNCKVLMGKAVGLDLRRKEVLLQDGKIEYDTLVVACGSVNNYFGNDDWEKYAPGLKSIGNAISIRAKVLGAFEKAERESDPKLIESLLTFIIVGGGTTGIELAGALKEIAVDTLDQEFRNIDPNSARVILIEGHSNLLPTYPVKLSEKAVSELQKLGVEIMTSTYLKGLDHTKAFLEQSGKLETIQTSNIIWAAGVKASPFGKHLSEATGLPLDKSGKFKVEPDMSLKDNSDIFVIGDMVLAFNAKGKPLPGIAPVAMQQGKYVAKRIKNDFEGIKSKNFKYRDFGNMATIGRSSAVVDMGWFQFHGFFAWIFWLFIHLMYIVSFQNRVLVFVQWGWNYFTRNKSARLITKD